MAKGLAWKLQAESILPGTPQRKDQLPYPLDLRQVLERSQVPPHLPSSLH